MDILEFHNVFRHEKGLCPYETLPILNEFAAKNAKWMARRKFHCFWNFDKVRTELITNYQLVDIDFNIAAGDTEDIIMKHFLNNFEKSNLIFANYKYIGFGSFTTKYRHWCVLYAK